MRDSLSVDRDVNSIRLRRSTFSGTFILVEGSSDRVFYERLFDRVACALISLSGKPSSKVRVIAVLSTLEESNFQGVLALVDADFDRLKTSSHSSPNLIRTDTHDLETMLLNSPALEKLLAEFGSEEKIGNLGRDVRSVLLETAMTVGYLRWISQIDELNLTFDGITFSKFINDQTLQIDEDKFIQEVKNKSQAFGLKSADLKQRLIDERSCNHDLWQVCCGHDLVEILSLSLRKTIGSAKASDVEPSNLERSLRLAYEEIYFHKTQIYLSILAWEINTQPFQVFQLTS
jgi:Protein of unknown function (DUF4435)